MFTSLRSKIFTAFAILSTSLFMGACTSPEASAPIDTGKMYSQLTTPIARSDSDPTHIEIRELFFYGCSHCYTLHQRLQRWKKPQNVTWVRTPVAFQDSGIIYSQAFYALQRISPDEMHHDAFFHLIQDGDKNLNDPKDLLATVRMLYQEDPLHTQEFFTAMDSPDIIQQVREAQSLVHEVHLEGTPALIVNGKYLIYGLSTDDTVLAIQKIIHDLEQK